MRGKREEGMRDEGVETGVDWALYHWREERLENGSGTLIIALIINSFDFISYLYVICTNFAFK
jgi:hypothetical protein